MAKACDMIAIWNKDISKAEDYISSTGGMQTLAASCMLIESIGESVKKIDKLLPGFLECNAPEIPWQSIKGIRDHIAHGYFNIDAEIIYDVISNELPNLKRIFESLKLNIRDLL